MNEWTWKFAFWITTFLVPPLLGIYLDSLCKIGKLQLMVPIGIILLIVILLVSSAAGRALRLCGHSRKARRLTPPDKLVTSSVFSCMRHPNQFSMSFMPLAISMILGSPCGVLLSGWGIALGLAFILYVEEKLVHESFCPEYCEYAKEVRAVSLSPKCIVEAIRTLLGASKC
ncbi:hypothetical protein EYM_01840 [Ignicoccus islandicus DSM 13165]|uniref:Uncharacterized protein n=1 Tax=Ignicoccus islandicus DSM 13165 TaxID=940295 RepID=A0A0U3FPP1_9CREN|nr:methyltransferase [Ignicoccus islandicus]ALU12255.1 hypothetical protein EYM_01840 [Ignicoccus islandicus DSM 13165]